MGKYTCYYCGREIKTKLIKLDLGQGDMPYFHDKCLDKWISKNTKEVDLKKE